MHLSLRRPISKAFVALWVLSAALPSKGSPLLAGGPLDSTSFFLGGTLCQAFSSKEVPFSLLPSGGGLPTIEAINEGLVDMGILPEIWVDRFYHKNNKDFTSVHLRSVVHLGDMDLVVLVRQDSPFKTLEDLAGHTITVASATQGTEDLLSLLLEPFSPFKKPSTAILSKPIREETLHLFCQGKVDAIAVLDSSPNEHVFNTIAACPVRILSAPKHLLQSVTHQYPSLRQTSLKENIYGKALGSHDLFTTRALLVTTLAFPAPLLESALLNLRQHFDHFKTLHVSLRHLTFEAMLKNTSIPLHQGVRNVLSRLPELEAKEKKEKEQKKKEEAEQKKKAAEMAKHPFGAPHPGMPFPSAPHGGAPFGPFGGGRPNEHPPMGTPMHAPFFPGPMENPFGPPVNNPFGPPAPSPLGSPPSASHGGGFEEEGTLPPPPAPPGSSQPLPTLPAPQAPKAL